MARNKRLKILLQPEIDDLYNPPRYTLEQQRYFFSLNVKELAVAKSIRKREHRCYFVAMLGYFRSKPIILNPSFRSIESDLSFIAKETFPGNKLRRFSLNQKQRDRLYEKLFSINYFKRWKEREHYQLLFSHLKKNSQYWIEPRYLFDSAVEFYSTNKIAIPHYSNIQKAIGDVIQDQREYMELQIERMISPSLKSELVKLDDGEAPLRLSHLWQSAKNFSANELAKELRVHNYIYPKIKEVGDMIKALILSPRNQQHFASMVKYYKSKIKRLNQPMQLLYLLCYFQQRSESNLERIADGFIYHLRIGKRSLQTWVKQRIFYTCLWMVILITSCPSAK